MEDVAVKFNKVYKKVPFKQHCCSAYIYSTEGTVHNTLSCSQNKYYSDKTSRPNQPNPLAMLPGDAKVAVQDPSEENVLNCTVSRVEVNTAEETVQQTKGCSH